MQVTNFFLQGPLVIYPRNSIEFGLKRLEAFSFDLHFVHAGSVIVADFLLVRALVRADILCGGFQNLAQYVAILFVQDVPDAPRRKGRGNRIGLEPPAVGVLIEVCTGRRARVHAGDIEVRDLAKGGGHAKGHDQGAGDESFE